MFDKVFIVIAINSEKDRRIEPEIMKGLIEQVMIDESITEVEVEVCHDLVVRFAEKRNADYIVRGLRNITDFQYEEDIAEFNKGRCSYIETIYVRADDSSISSSMVMELRKYGEDVSEYLPNAIDEYFSKNNN